jgi:hypothetical protein
MVYNFPPRSGSHEDLAFRANDIADPTRLNWFCDKYWWFGCSGDVSPPLEWTENRIGDHETVKALPEVLEPLGPAQLITGSV